MGMELHDNPAQDELKNQFKSAYLRHAVTTTRCPACCDHMPKDFINIVYAQFLSMVI
jgi:hypothetical protein